MDQQPATTSLPYQDRLLLRPREVAVATGLSRSMVYELIGRAELPVVRVGKSVRVPVAALQEWIRSHTAAATPSVHPPAAGHVRP